MSDQEPKSEPGIFAKIFGYTLGTILLGGLVIFALILVYKAVEWALSL